MNNESLFSSINIYEINVDCVFVILRKHAGEISLLHQKLGNLQTQIKHLQNITKPYKKVKKLSYGEKKRILVSIFLFRLMAFSLFLNM